MSQLCDEQRAFLANTGNLHEIGDLVVVHSLSSEHWLNGRRGHICRRLCSKGRLGVRMEAGLGLKAIKPSNLWPVLDSDEDIDGPVLDYDEDNEDEWMRDGGFGGGGDGDAVSVDLGLSTRSHGLVHHAVAISACREDPEGPLLLEAVAGARAQNQRWGDGYNDEASTSADTCGAAADHEQCTAWNGTALGKDPLWDPSPPLRLPRQAPASRATVHQ